MPPWPRFLGANTLTLTLALSLREGEGISSQAHHERLFLTPFCKKRVANLAPVTYWTRSAGKMNCCPLGRIMTFVPSASF